MSLTITGLYIVSFLPPLWSWILRETDDLPKNYLICEHIHHMLVVAIKNAISLSPDTKHIYVGPKAQPAGPHFGR